MLLCTYITLLIISARVNIHGAGTITLRVGLNTFSLSDSIISVEIIQGWGEFKDIQYILYYSESKLTAWFSAPVS